MAEYKQGGSLLSPEMMGGITATSGFDFQTRYITCHLPHWTQNSDFKSFINEGTGDVDLNFKKPSGTGYKHHIQIKNHNVTPSKLKEIVSKFKELDNKLPGIYERFTLASLSISESLKPLLNALSRYRGAAPFFEDTTSALNDTSSDLKAIFTSQNLEEYYDFAIEKLFFETPLPDYNSDSHALDVFKGRILGHPLYQEAYRQALEGLYSYLFKELSAQRGKNLENTFLEGLLKSSLSQSLKALTPKKVITIHNWAVQRFDLKADYELDHSAGFDRDSRKVPTKEFWKDTIEADIKRIRKDILEASSDRLILFQGQASLSTGILFGKNFPSNSGWIIDYKQPTSEIIWSSGASPQESGLSSSYEEIDPNGSDLLFAFSITGNAKKAVIDASKNLQLNPKGILIIGPHTPGSLSITSSEQAVGVAVEAKDILYKTIQDQGTVRTHSFYFGPQAIALFFGQRLTSIGEIVLYDYQDPGYVETIRFKT